MMLSTSGRCGGSRCVCWMSGMCLSGFIAASCNTGISDIGIAVTVSYRHVTGFSLQHNTAFKHQPLAWTVQSAFQSWHIYYSSIWCWFVKVFLVLLHKDSFQLQYMIAGCLIQTIYSLLVLPSTNFLDQWKITSEPWHYDSNGYMSINRYLLKDQSQTMRYT